MVETYHYIYIGTILDNNNILFLPGRYGNWLFSGFLRNKTDIGNREYGFAGFFN